MKTYLTIVLLLAGNFFLSAQQAFPNLTCETLNNKTLSIPTDTKGKKTVVVLALSAKAEKELKAWSTPLYNSLLTTGMGGLMGGRMYNANLCFVGMLKGVAKLASGELKERSKKNIDKKLWDNYMISEQEMKPFIEASSISKTDEPQFFVLDKDGNIIFHTSGKYTDEKLDEITGKLL